MEPRHVALAWLSWTLACGASSPPGGAGPDGGAAEASKPRPGVDGSAPADVRVRPVYDAKGDVAVSSSYGPYGAAGPDTVTVASADVAPPTTSKFSVSVYTPSGTGPFPVVFLSSGFFQPAAAYAPYGERLASWGIVAVLRDHPGLGESSTDLAADLSYEVATWLPAQAKAGPFAGRVDDTRVGLAGHSRGGQASFLAAEGDAKGRTLGLFGLDPVDGTPAAIPEAGAIAIPTAFVGETTDSAGSGMPCAPAGENYQAFYAAAPSPSVAMTAIGADHTTFEDPASCVACSLCAPGTAVAADVLALSVRYLTAFFARELLGDATVGPTFVGAGSTLDAAAGLVSLASK